MDLNRLRQLSGTRPLYESIQAIPAIGEAITPKDIDDAQNEIDFDSGTQPFEEDIESPAQVVSCNQDNPASANKACAMKEGMREVDKRFLASSVRDALTYVKNMDELLNVVSQETKYSITPDFKDAVQEIYNDYYGLNTEPEEPEQDYTDWSMRQGEMGMEEAYDMNNGYNDVTTADGQDYFPTGADGPVVDKAGPSGAEQGDNPEQKKMDVAETHKELVYNYRAFLKESASKK